MEKIAISKFKQSCIRLIERVRTTGEPILITKNGGPAAMVVPPPKVKKAQVRAGSLKGAFTISGDIVCPLGDSDWEGLR